MLLRVLRRLALTATFATLATFGVAGCGGGGGGVPVGATPTLPQPGTTPASGNSGGATSMPSGAATSTPKPGSGTATASPLPNGAGTSSPAPGAASSPQPVVTTAPGTPTSGSRGSSPGPEILYEPLATAPQLVNTGIWQASPILVSGASSYRRAEYVYQDFLYDDYGAKGGADANQTNELNADLLAEHTGTYTYPTNSGYASNAADLVEFRMKPTDGATAFRITLNTMVDPSLYAFTIGLGSTPTSNAMPYGANASEPAQIFVTVHGTVASVTDGLTGLSTSGPSATVTVDQTHRQIQVLVPYATFDTRSQTALRVAIATGLWDNANQKYLTPATTSSATAAGGAAGVSPAAFFNVGFRHSEPSTGSNLPTVTTSPALGTYWRDQSQALALTQGDLFAFADTVDMTKLAAGVNDDMNLQPQGVPLTGHMNRIFSSHYEPFQGRAFTGCSGSSTNCPAELGSGLEPYAIYVPVKSAPSGGYPLTLLLHSLSCNYNQYANSHYEMEFGERGNGNIVFTTESRGPDNWYAGLAEAEVFEVWADVQSHYPIDDNSVAISGYSMGGYATFRLGAQFPDLFGIAQPTVGPSYIGSDQSGPGAIDPMLASFRNIPLLSWHGSADELVQVPFALLEEQAEAAANLNFEWDVFTADHLALVLNDSFVPAAIFLGEPVNNINPPHVTFVRNPSMDDAAQGVVADHAYWVSSVAERSTASVTGMVDVFSGGFGVGDPPVSGISTTSGSLPPGNLGVLAYTGFKNTYGAAPVRPISDSLTIVATNIASITIAPARARVSCDPQIAVTSDGPLTVTLAGCPSPDHSFSKGRSVEHIVARPARR